MTKDFNKLIQKIDKKEEVKEEKDNLDEQLHLLKQAVTNLQYCVMEVEKADIESSYARVAAQNFGQDTAKMDAYLKSVGSSASSLIGTRTP